MELMVTLALGATLLAVGVPNLQSFMRNNRLTGASNDLLRSIQLSRGEAIKRQRRVVVCASANPSAGDPDCSNGAFRGWVVFEDANNNWAHDSAEAVIERHDSVDATLTVLTDNSGIVSFNQTGFANPAEGSNVPTRTVVFRDSRGYQQVGNNVTARAVLIDATGRARVVSSQTEVCGVLTYVSESCT